jgi:hypothetical protein
MYLLILITEINIRSRRNAKRRSDSVITSVEKWGYVQVQIIHCQNIKITSSYYSR